MKRTICLLLTLAMLLSCAAPAFAEDGQDGNETPLVTEEREEEPLPTVPDGDETEAPEETAAPDGDAEEVPDGDETLPATEGNTETELPEEETTLSEDETYLKNIVLFTVKKVSTLTSLSDQLDALGLYEIEPVFTDEDGEPMPMGSKGEFWYRAYTERDASAVSESLMELRGVLYAEPDYVYSADSIGQPTEVEEQLTGWVYDALLKLDTSFWWNTFLNHDFAPGSGTVVAVIDTGVDYDHVDLKANMWVNEAELNGLPGVDDDGNGIIDDVYGADMTATGSKAGDPMDDNGHGTHVAGIIGMSPNGTGGVGLAYGAKIMAIKAGQSTGTFSSSHIAKAINYAKMMGADVINMSFGGTSQSYLVETALEDAFSTCVLVAAAGNSGKPTTDAMEAGYLATQVEDIYPAAYSYVLGVMATDQYGKLADFSNWDYKPNANAEYELTAPGVKVYSTLPGDRYATWSGTSMAAPCVAAAAAILRSNYPDKETYSARFIMGQLASAGEKKTDFTAPMKDKSYSYAALDIYNSIVNPPKPNITVKDTFLLDSTDIDTGNDGDGRVDAGEVIDLGVLVRNQWGLTGNITVKADALSDAGVPNPFITFLNDTVTLQPAGTFQEVNNGFTYDDSLLVSVSDPIRFRVVDTATHDAEVRIRLTVTTTNGADSTDEKTYLAAKTLTFRINAGKGISGILEEDTTLTSNYLWVVENTLLIPEGITLTIEPGTQVQFYSSDYEDAYGGWTIPLINCEGTLNAIGTEEQPIEMFPGAGFEDYCVQIGGKGVETLKYCKIINPAFQGNNSGYGTYYSYCVNTVDHCELIQNYTYPKVRYTSEGIISSGNRSTMYVGSLTNSILKNIRNGTTGGQLIGYMNVENCLFENCGIRRTGLISTLGTIMKNSVYLSSGDGYGRLAYWNPYAKSVNTGSVFEFVEGTNGHSYALLRVYPNPYTSGTNDLLFRCYSAIAEELGGTLAVINDEEELAFLKEALKNYSQPIFLGAQFSFDSQKVEWLEESSVKISQSSTDKYFAGFYPSGGIFTDSSIYGKNVLLEFPNSVTEKQVQEVLDSFDYEEFLGTDGSAFINNAVLNPLLNTDTTKWTRFIGDSYNPEYSANYLSYNYWGTENEKLIDKMIIDGHDFPGTYQEVVTDPILTLESESLSDIYPFVTQVYLTDTDGNLVANVSSGGTYTVHVCYNRDMDEDVQPSVTFGGEEPYTDYAVSGNFVSAREWQGTVKISPVLTGGTMYWRTKGGAAADDGWLVCGEDVLRFSFNIGATGALAMVLNASGGANKVELSWAQNDYDTFAGYNIYRSESESSGFTKINTSIVTGGSYTDTDVKPGVTYYYYFKVVNTDGNEEAGVSNTASGRPIDNIYPILTHTATMTAKLGVAISLTATATDNIAVTSVTLYYRAVGEGSWHEIGMTTGMKANSYTGTIPASAVKAAGIQYYIAARDGGGNVSYSGTADDPNVIAVDSTPYIIGITPSKVDATGGQTVTILGRSLSADMTMKIDGVEVTEKSFNATEQQFTFLAPAMASGSHTVTLTTADGMTSVSVGLAYADKDSRAEIPASMKMTSGVPYTIPLTVTASGEVIALHAELDLPSADFKSVTVEKADKDASYSLDYTWSSGKLVIGCIATGNILPQSGAVLHIVVTPRVSEAKQYVVTLHDVSLNDVEVAETISGQTTILPSFLLNAQVNYFSGSKGAVQGVTVKAAGVSAATDASGKAALTVSEKAVTVAASKSERAATAITAYDAALVLQSAVGKVTLSDEQKLAADVDGNSKVSEYDAALILQMAVKKIVDFQGVVWVFSPATIEKTLSADSATSVRFTAILLGDVDGSYGEGDAE